MGRVGLESCARNSLVLFGFKTLANIIYRVTEILDAGAGDDDAISFATSFLGDAEKFSAVIFSELNNKVLPFRREFPRRDDVFVGGKTHGLQGKG